LTNGGVWVLASTPLNPETKAKIDELGPVQCVFFSLRLMLNLRITRYIIGADAGHHLFLGAAMVGCVATVILLYLVFRGI
jgi:hypothetical protein